MKRYFQRGSLMHNSFEMFKWMAIYAVVVY